MTESPPATDLLRRMPKVDLHCHLDGSLRPRTVWELAKKLKIKMPADSAEALRPFIEVGPTCRSLKEFLDVFDLLYPLLRLPEAVERIAYELAEDCAQENIRYVEARFAPALQATGSFTTDGVVEAVLKGLRKGKEDFGVESNVIICLFRSHGPKENRAAFQTLKKYFAAKSVPGEPRAAGLDLAGDEARYPTRDYADFYEEARRLGIHTTCHAGETEGTENLSAALELGVQRIGHGTHLLEDDKLLKEVVRRRVPLEIGLSSNLMTKSAASLEEHPAREFFLKGVPITLNTDDRGILGISLTHEYGQAIKLGFSLPELAKVCVDSVDHIFTDAARRARLKARFEAEMSGLLEGEAKHAR